MANDILAGVPTTFTERMSTEMKLHQGRQHWDDRRK